MKSLYRFEIWRASEIALSMPVKFQSDCAVLNTTIRTSGIREILRSCFMWYWNVSRGCFKNCYRFAIWPVTHRLYCWNACQISEGSGMSIYGFREILLEDVLSDIEKALGWLRSFLFTNLTQAWEQTPLLSLTFGYRMEREVARVST